MMELVLTWCALLACLLGVIIQAGRSTRDAMLVLVLLIAVVTRSIIGALNIAVGPLPGAEVDAVVYEQHAHVIARSYLATGHFVFEIGRLGYSSLLAVPYIFGGRQPLFPTVVNAIFAAHFVLLAYRIALLLNSRRRVAQLAAAGAAFYPTSLFYTAVPLREAPLVWGFALCLYGLLLYLRGEARVFGWRVLVGWLFTTWLHSGFIILGLGVALAWGLKNVNGRRLGEVIVGRLGRVTAAGLAALGIFVGLMVVGKIVPLAYDPGELANPDEISELRQRKASYGTGYLGEVSEGWLGLAFDLPLMMLAFIFAPLLFTGPGGESPTDTVKILDALVFAGIFFLAVARIVRSKGGGQRDSALLIAGILLIMLVVFSLGTANVGIAVRHRAKFAWLLFLVVAAIRARSKERDIEKVSAVLVGRH